MEARLRRCLADWLGSEVADAAGLENLGGHASLRIYWRIHLPEEFVTSGSPRGEETLMAMVLPAGVDPLTSAEGESSATVRPPELPFVNVQRLLAYLGLPVPGIDRVDLEQGVVILEDLGDVLFEHALLDAPGPQKRRELYREAIDLLIQLQASVEAVWIGRCDTGCVAFQRRFDEDLYLWEFDHYLEWGLQAQLGVEHVKPFQESLRRIFQRIAEELAAGPQTLALRDFQSRNIMRKKGDWILIDFQDALIAPVIYDLVALLRDSYIELTEFDVSELLDYYVSAGREAGLSWCADGPKVRRLFYLQTVQRKLKDAGWFIFIDRVKGNPSFLDYYGPSIGYVREALGQLEDLAELSSVLAEVEPAFEPPQESR
jgi:N-acetylmuramate 1-kinase